MATPVTETIDRIRLRVDRRLTDFLATHPAPIDDPDLVHAYRLLADFITGGGKRLRPILCYWGWRGAGGAESHEDLVVTVGAAIELCHAGLLIHDDIMDGSALRRGRPTLHRALAHPASPAQGHSAAILLGLQAQIWADELLNDLPLADPPTDTPSDPTAHAGSTPGITPERVRAVRALFCRMRSEAISGQYLDILARVHENPDIKYTFTSINYKTAKYTVERPLHIGGLLAGADSQLLTAYSRIGIPLGEAFQLRDDVLGVFGDTETTGKPTIDDLREGRHTALIAYTTARARGPQRELLRTWHGNPDLDERHAAELRQIIEETGALAYVEDLIEQRVDQALAALRASPLQPPTTTALSLLATRLTSRTR